MTFRKIALFFLIFSILGSGLMAQTAKESAKSATSVHHTAPKKGIVKKKKVVVKKTISSKKNPQKIPLKKAKIQAKAVAVPIAVRSVTQKSLPTSKTIQKPIAAAVPPSTEPIKKTIEAPASIKETRVIDRGSDKDIEIELSGMVEPTSVRKNTVQAVALWTSIPILKDDASKKLFSLNSKSVKLKGVLVQDGNGKWILKVKTIESVGDQ